MEKDIDESFKKTRLAGSIAASALDEVSKIIKPGIKNNNEIVSISIIVGIKNF